MPQIAYPVAVWVGNTIASVAGASVAAGGISAVLAGTASNMALAAAITSLGTAAIDIAFYAGLSYAIDAVSRPKIKPAGSELLFNMDPAYPREMIIGQRPVGGSMVARYSRGSNLYNAHLVIQLADHPCTELSEVWDGGRVVRSSPLTHGTRTEITAYSNSGGARVWMTWHDGRPGQTADSDLVTKSAQDPDVVAGKIPGWSSDHRGAGCAYVHVEVQWDSDILTSIPQFLFLVKGAPLYDRRKDSTAGGSGSHRLDDPSTWEYSTNAAVALDHYLLGYQVEDDDLAFGVGLHPSEVPYDQFANAADLADEDVETGTGGDVETIKRYAINGVVSAADYFEETIEAMQIQMAARVVDLGGRIGILGAEERDIVVDLDEGDLVSGEQMQFADKLGFEDLYGSVAGTFADPANLYQQTPYATQYTSYNALPDGGEAQQVQLSLPLEIHPRRAVRLVSAWLGRESLQPRLVARFMPKAWKLEAGDWFTFTSERLQISLEKFEVIDIAKHDDFTVTLTARAINPAFLAFDNDNDPDLSVPPAVDPVSRILDAPAFTPTATTISGGGATEPVIQVVATAPNPVTRELILEAREWNGTALTGPSILHVGHADDLTSILRQGLKPGAQYKVRMKARAGARESAWSEWSSAITLTSTYVVPAAVTAGSASGDLADDLSDIAADIAASEARLDSAEDTLDLHGTDIGTLETVTAGQATLITGLQAYTQPSPNLLLDPTFRLGAGNAFSSHWSESGGTGWFRQADVYGLGSFAQIVAGGTQVLDSVGYEVVSTGDVYSLSAEFRLPGLSAGVCLVDIHWTQADGTHIGYSDPVGFDAGGYAAAPKLAPDWARDESAPGVGLTAPALAARAYVRAYIAGATNTDSGVRKIKFERGATATLYSDDASPQSLKASITEVATVASDLETATAALDSRLDVAEGDVDGLQSTASNHTTRLAAIDGGSTSATSIAQLVAKTNAGQNLMPHPSGRGDGAAATALGWNPEGAAVGGSGLLQINNTGEGPRYLEYWASGFSSGSSRNHFYDVPVPEGGNYAVSFAGYVLGFPSATAYCFIEALNAARDTSLGFGATAYYSATDRKLAIINAHANTRWLRIRWGVPSQTVAGYCEINFCQIKVERGTAATVFTDDAQALDLRASITEIESVNSDQDSAIAVIDSRMDVAETDIDGVQSTASNLSIRLAAVDGGSVSARTLNQVRAEFIGAGANWVPDPSFKLGDGGSFSEHWVEASGTDWYRQDDPYGLGCFAQIVVNAAYQDLFTASYQTVSPGDVHTLQAEFRAAGLTAGAIIADIQWLDSGGSHLGFSAGCGFDPTSYAAASKIEGGWARATVTVTAPTSAARAKIRVYLVSATNTDSGVRRIKMEKGSVATVFTDDGTPGALSSKIGGIGARVDTLDEAFVDAGTGLAIARFVKEASATGGRPARFSLYSDSEGTADAAIDAARIFFGDNTVFEDAYNTFYTEDGGKRLRYGGPFGASGDLFMWSGPDSVPLNSETKANAKFAIAVDEDLPIVDGGTITTPTIDDATKTATASFDNVTTSGTTLHTMATIDLTVGAGGFLELLSPLFYGPLSLSQETGMTLSAGTDWFGQMIVTEQLQSGGTEHTLWNIPLQISDTGGGLFDFIFDPPVTKVVAQNVSGASRYRIKLQRVSGSNNVSGNGLQGKFTIRRTP